MRDRDPADWLTPAAAWQRIAADIRPLEPAGRELACCLGHVLAEPVGATLDLPPWDNSAMDGFAVQAADIRTASAGAPVVLEIVDDIPAGGFPSRPIGAGQAARIMTGAPVPEGADSVVRVEHTAAAPPGTRGVPRVRIGQGSDAGRNIRPRGEDVRNGSEVLSPGRVISAADIGLAASLGRGSLQVFRRPRVGVLSTGNELVSVLQFDEVLAGRKIVSSNSYALAARLRGAGFDVVDLGIAPDDPAAIRDHLLAASGCDAVISTAGMSVGEHDHLRSVLLEQLGSKILFWRVRMRPGSPFAYGRIGALAGMPWFGLPGNPVSALVTLELFAIPALLAMAGEPRLFLPTVQARFAGHYPAAPGLAHFSRVRLAAADGGAWEATPTGAQGSGILASMSAADGLMMIPANAAGAADGDLLRILVLGAKPLVATPPF